MTDPGPDATTRRVRREPPRYRRVRVLHTDRLGPRMIRVALGGPELEGLVVAEPAASVRLLLPPAGSRELVMPSWNGNEFLLPDGRRPRIRTFTPRRVDGEVPQLDLEIVVHGGGAASAWAEATEPGDEVAVSGPGRGYAVDPGGRRFLLAGDETAIPAMSQLLEALPGEASVQVRIEVAGPDGRLELPHHPGATVQWCDLPEGAPPGEALVLAVTGAEIGDATRAWVAGEAAAVQRVRRHLFEDRRLPRSQAHVRGYWKHGRSGDVGDT